MPGGPRTHPIDRHPHWDKKDFVFEQGWFNAVASESHELTLKELPNGEPLTGEPFGRQTWHFDQKKTTSGGKDTITHDCSVNPNTSDKIFRAQRIAQWKARGGKVPEEKWVPKDAKDCARKGIAFYQMLQCDDGHWAGDYGGPHFLMPGMIVVWYVTGKDEDFLPASKRRAMRHYLTVHQQADGGWGTHIESPSTMFGTTLCYVALRLLGVSGDDPRSVKAQKFIKAQKGALYTASWAKFYLCLLGVMHWDGHCSIPAEFWMLPDWFPFHPGRLWCHCRMVYLPMSYLYGKRFVYADAEKDPVTLALRKELYCEEYDGIDWDATRHWVAPMDNYSPKPWTMRYAQDLLAYWERYGGGLLRMVRHWGMDYCIDYMAAEDLQTNFICIGPVNKVLNMLCAWDHGGRKNDNPKFQRHLLRIPDYLWVAEDGMKMQGYNGSQCWDTSFAVQAAVEGGLAEEFPQMTRMAYEYFERTQILSTEVSKKSPAYAYEDEESRRKYYRHVSEGGWPFSTSAHGWPISDCTSEGLKGVLLLRELNAIKNWGKSPKISDQRLFNACNVLLTLQNFDGGFATYENNRGYGWYEALNPSEVFGDIMIDYSYVECTTASLTGLTTFHKLFPKHRTEEIKSAISRARNFLKSIQRKDGSWYGSWACCFTYAAWFGVEGLLLCGEPTTSPNIRACVEFLKKHQKPNGGWGEDFRSCFDKSYAKEGMKAYGDSQGAGIVPTAWALLAIAAAKNEKDRECVEKGVKYLISRQLPSGDWPQEGISGVFNRSCGITYTAYRNVFPIWALGRYSNKYLPAVGGKGV
uniref:Terpene cyclase/mutase family member n=1 Tax=Lotharella oceanica TaxID=641309 RepID=A0A7S2U1C0_9EUKA